MPYYCTVPRCTSMAGKAKNVSFHQFPRNEVLARLWNDILKRGKPYTKYSKVCSLHFKPEDYTITSVGKNKGQWRTLRKDAVPSQNLPSETPAPYSRKQWESWSQNSSAPVMDPNIHQQVAQAIYMQTMLAMQAAGTTESLHQNEPELPQTSNHDDILKGNPNIDTTSYKCTDCTKCFKDPDVFILHKRTHTKDKTNGVEKENFNMNLTLRSNPILANLLKTNSEVNFDPSLVTMENLLMTALAANIDYLRNYNSEDSDGNRDRIELNHDRIENRDRIDLNHDRIDSNRDGIELNHDRIENHDRIDVNRDRIDVNRDRIELKHDRSENNAMIDLNRLKSELNYRSVEMQSKSDSNLIENEKNPITKFNFLKKDRSFDRTHETSEKGLKTNHTSENNTISNHIRGEISVRSDLNHFRGEENHLSTKNDDNLSYAIDFTSKEIDRSAYGNYYKDCEGTSDNYRHCDNDLNDSIDSNSLVIDESV